MATPGELISHDVRRDREINQGLGSNYTAQ